MKKIKMMILLLAASVLVLAACGTDEEKTSDTTEDQGYKLVNKGKFTFAASGVYKPFSFEEDGKLTGFDIEIGNALAEKMGLEANPVTNPFETILQGLVGNKFDAIIGSMAYTKERAEQADFTEPYYYSGGMIFVAKDNEEITSPEDLDGKKIGVVAQSTYEEPAKELSDDVQYYSSDVVALKDLTVKGRLDAVITADIVGYEAIDNGFEIKEVDKPMWVEQPSIAVNKENPELTKALDEALQEMMDDGTYEEISDKWFGRNLLDIDLEGVELLE
ncbi:MULTISPECIES: transporter substrate-binding domain-containing protein [unclassified Sporosarcina]|uniref:transporter substrate-binding domain-containing protein n=1 Tax=Sporosarcina sp. P29 TaxID=2048252 RepID=UPI000C1664A7|nr:MULTISPECIES: transporter substrate-binding domain-containing protein [unclassified Sporosarcina]PID00321.1 ABC transporter substrate-binding protein [Sporosarcina sp. P29]PID06564.1 ABC transporter substrate-binding protein [Sporosarcina sp. P30]PID09758.1 ABC transporter substrate-binding protein [Sporosarcina sp. P31]PID13337.1 ABC transporter substrate-binding protein [Sporosarcina sp. P32b]